MPYYTPEIQYGPLNLSRRCRKVIDKTEHWTDDELSALVGISVVRIAYLRDATLRDTGNLITNLVEQGWAARGRDITRPVRTGSYDG